MDVRVLGAHNLERLDVRHTCFLIDDVLALDAGSLASALTPAEQAEISAVMLTHSHFDHVRDIPTLGLATLGEPGCTEVFGLAETLNAVHKNLLNWEIYPDLTVGIDGGPPKFRLTAIVPAKALNVLSYEVKPVLVPHPVPCVGYIVKDPSGDCIAYTGDTAGALSSFLRDPMRPRVLFVDLTFPNRMHELAELTGHLTPKGLKRQLAAAVKAGIGPTRVVAVHISSEHESEVAAELGALARELPVQLELGYEEMRVTA